MTSVLDRRANGPTHPIVLKIAGINGIGTKKGRTTIYIVQIPLTRLPLLAILSIYLSYLSSKFMLHPSDPPVPSSQRYQSSFHRNAPRAQVPPTSRSAQGPLVGSMATSHFHPPQPIRASALAAGERHKPTLRLLQNPDVPRQEVRSCFRLKPTRQGNARETCKVMLAMDFSLLSHRLPRGAWQSRTTARTMNPPLSCAAWSSKNACASSTDQSGAFLRRLSSSRQLALSNHPTR